MVHFFVQIREPWSMWNVRVLLLRVVFYFVFGQYWCLNCRSIVCYAGTLSFESCRQPFFAWVVFQVGSCLFASGCISPTRGLPQAGITGTHHHAHLIGWDEISLAFCPGRSWTTILLISTHWVALITDEYLCAQPWVVFLSFKKGNPSVCLHSVFTFSLVVYLEP
jgi:hypothetical protein